MLDGLKRDELKSLITERVTGCFHMDCNHCGVFEESSEGYLIFHILGVK